MNSNSLLKMTAPCRQDFEIAYHEIGPSDQELALALVAGTHGNELNGVFILSRLADYLNGIAAEKQKGVRLVKRVLIVPAVNVLGFNIRSRLWPFDKTDLNRMFPGYDQGETTQRIASALLKVCEPAAYRIDFHSNVEVEELPHLRAYQPDEGEKTSAMKFGLNVIEKSIKPALTVSLIQAWKNLSGESFVMRGGLAGDLQLKHCEAIFQALLQFLKSIGALVGEKEFNREEETSYYLPSQNHRLISNKAGFFVSKLEVGHEIRVGDLIGYLYDSFTGEVREEIRSPQKGKLLAIRRQPLIYQGDIIAKILIKLQD